MTQARGEHGAINTYEQLTWLGVPTVTLPCLTATHTWRARTSLDRQATRIVAACAAGAARQPAALILKGSLAAASGQTAETGLAQVPTAATVTFARTAVLHRPARPRTPRPPPVAAAIQSTTAP